MQAVQVFSHSPRYESSQEPFVNDSARLQRTNHKPQREFYMPRPKKKTSAKKELSRRGFIQLAGAAGAAAGLTTWTPTIWAQSASTPSTLAPALPSFDFKTNDDIAAFLKLDLKNDPGAKYFRSRVPVAKRIPAFSSTQAHPLLSDKPQLSNLMADFASIDVNPLRQYNFNRYGNGYVYVSRFGQYQDIVVAGTSSVIDAAHRNGALCLWWMSTPEGAFDTFLQYGKDKDGNDDNKTFPVADKYLDLAQYFGFDGYFINGEIYISKEQGKKFFRMLQYMQKQAKMRNMNSFYIHLYDSMTPTGALGYQGEINSVNGDWITQGAVNSIYIDYRWSAESYSWSDGGSSVTHTTKYCNDKKLDPFQVAYYGLETQGGFGQESLRSPDIIPQNGTGPALGSLGLFLAEGKIVEISRYKALQSVKGVTAPADWFDKDQSTFLSTLTDAQMKQYQTAFLKQTYYMDRCFWSGWMQNPASDNAGGAKPLYSSNDADSAWRNPYHPGIVEQSNDNYAYGLETPPLGLANFITERSVIGSTPFITRFNTGSGDQFFLNGTVASTNPWYSMGIQDILPTWQWWVKDYYQNATTSGLLSVDYDHNIAFNGGSSIRVSGDLGPLQATEIRLFKTALKISGSPRLRITLYETTEGAVQNMQLGLIFEDDPTWTLWVTPNQISVTPSGWGAHWRYADFNLSGYAQRTIASISLGFKLRQPTSFPDNKIPASKFMINIGEISVIDPNIVTTPAIPESFTIDNSQKSKDGTSAQLYLSWKFNEKVWYYDIYQLNGTVQQWLGRIYDEVYYVEALQRIGKATKSTLQLVAVAPDGTQSKPATTDFSWS